MMGLQYKFSWFGAGLGVWMGMKNAPGGAFGWCQDRGRMHQSAWVVVYSMTMDLMAKVIFPDQFVETTRMW